MIEPTRLPKMLQEIEAWLPVDLLQFACGILANLEARVSQLIVSPDPQLAADVVSLLDGWRFAAPPAKLDSFALRRIKTDTVRVVQVVDNRERISVATRAALQQIASTTPIVMAESRPRPTIREALPWLIVRLDTAIDEETRASRARFAPRARHALQRLLEDAIAQRAALLELEMPAEIPAQLAAVAGIVEQAESQRLPEILTPQLIAIARQRAFLSGRPALTVHDARFAVDVALAQLEPLTSEAIRFACHPERLDVDWPLERFEGERNDARRLRLKDLAERGLLIRQGELGQVTTYRAADALRALLI